MTLLCSKWQSQWLRMIVQEWSTTKKSSGHSNLTSCFITLPKKKFLSTVPSRLFAKSLMDSMVRSCVTDRLEPVKHLPWMAPRPTTSIVASFQEQSTRFSLRLVAVSTIKSQSESRLLRFTTNLCLICFQTKALPSSPELASAFRMTLLEKSQLEDWLCLRAATKKKLWTAYLKASNSVRQRTTTWMRTLLARMQSSRFILKADPRLSSRRKWSHPSFTWSTLLATSAQRKQELQASPCARQTTSTGLCLSWSRSS